MRSSAKNCSGDERGLLRSCESDTQPRQHHETRSRVAPLVRQVGLTMVRYVTYLTLAVRKRRYVRLVARTDPEVLSA